MDLPPVLGRGTRDPVILLVTGRTAVARIGGMTAVGRHFATARRLGLDPLVLYPERMRALGAEIAGELDDGSYCLPSGSFDREAGSDDALVLVIAGDWYISPRAIVEFSEETSGRAVARSHDREREISPMARLSVASVKALIASLEGNPSGELINQAAGEDAEVYELSVADRHRASDNVAVERAENKLFSTLRRSNEGWHVRQVQRRLSIPITRYLARTSVMPLQVCVAKIAFGFGAAWTLTSGDYLSGVAGALLYFLSRVLDGVAGELARAAVRDGSTGEKVDFAGDIAVQLAILWGLAAAVPAGAVLASVATAGVLASSWLAYSKVFRGLWRLRAAGRLQHMAAENFASRFSGRDGAAYGLLLASLIGRLDLFLWAATLSSHLFYILWIWSDSRAKQ